MNLHIGHDGPKAAQLILWPNNLSSYIMLTEKYSELRVQMEKSEIIMGTKQIFKFRVVVILLLL